MKSITLHTVRNGNQYWLGQITYTEDGMLAGVTEFGNFAHAWRSFGDDFEDFLLKIGPDYLAGKLFSDLLYFGMARTKAKTVSDRLAEIILPELKKAIKNSNAIIIRDSLKAIVEISPLRTAPIKEIKG